MVVKRDGRREPFDRCKIEAGVRSACKGRPVDEAAVAQLVVAVEDQLSGHGSEIDAAQIGDLVLEQLRSLDSVAALRFASVYKSFEDPEDFEREIQLLSRPDGEASAPAAS